MSLIYNLIVIFVKAAIFIHYFVIVCVWMFFFAILCWILHPSTEASFSQKFLFFVFCFWNNLIFSFSSLNWMRNQLQLQWVCRFWMGYHKSESHDHCRWHMSIAKHLPVSIVLVLCILNHRTTLLSHPTHTHSHIDGNTGRDWFNSHIVSVVIYWCWAKTKKQLGLVIANHFNRMRADLIILLRLCKNAKAQRNRIKFI